MCYENIFLRNYKSNLKTNYDKVAKNVNLAIDLFFYSLFKVDTRTANSLIKQINKNRRYHTFTTYGKHYQ